MRGLIKQIIALGGKALLLASGLFPRPETHGLK